MRAPSAPLRTLTNPGDYRHRRPAETCTLQAVMQWPTTGAAEDAWLFSCLHESLADKDLWLRHFHKWLLRRAAARGLARCV
jgi:hypothetical protein